MDFNSSRLLDPKTSRLLSSSLHPVPPVLSWPHFLHAEAKYSGGVQGLTPDPDKHGFWFDIQQVTGTTLSAKARIQINMKVQKIPSFDDLSKINDTLIPILWFEEGIDELGKERLMEICNTFILLILWSPLTKHSKAKKNNI